MTASGQLAPPQSVILDYDGADGLHDLVRNLSGAAWDGASLWTVSDEGRTVERLQQAGEGFGLAEQIDLDRLFAGLPDGKEADLESVDVVGGRVWVCGSHCRVRRKPRGGDALNSGFRRRPSRHLLGAFPADGAREGAGMAVPYLGEGSLRRRLRADPILSAFMNLPSKENGFDIEGLAIDRRRAFLGLRGPVVDSFAIVMELGLDRRGELSDAPPLLHALALRGLGIRDLARLGDDILVLAGPVTGADGPFRLHLWRPSRKEAVQAPAPVHVWPPGDEHPEGICRLARDGRDGLLVVYDAPDERRIEGARYRADWFAFET